MHKIVQEALDIERKEGVDDALDFLYSTMDKMMHAGEFEEIDRMLDETLPSRCTENIVLGILVTTLWAKNKLRNRSQFWLYAIMSGYEDILDLR